MKILTNTLLKKSHRRQAGQAMILALILLLIGSLTIGPVLSLVGSGLIANQQYETMADELYAADAGIEDALWEIRNNKLETLLAGYDAYDFNSSWAYTLTNPVNSNNVDITIANEWIPLGIATPDPNTARSIIESGKLIITGSSTSVASADEYEIKVSFNGTSTEASSLRILTLAIWLPPGFGYVNNSSSLEDDILADYYPISVTTTPHAGGEVVTWTFSVVYWEDFPSSITFKHDNPGQTPGALSWLTTAGVADVPFAWDAETKVHQILSTAGDTTVEAYSIKNELQKLETAISGDYRAIGNTSLVSGGTYNDYNSRTRDTLLTDSDATVNDIPDDAEVVAAYLYWSGWFEEGVVLQLATLFTDDCSNFSEWANPGSVWGIDSGEFRGRYNNSSAPDGHRYLTLSDSLDLSAYAGNSVIISWNQHESGWLESDDVLYFSFSHDGGSTWSSHIVAFSNDNPPSSFSYAIPTSYLTDNFKFRFYLAGFSGYGEYCYVDNIAITVGIFDDGCNNYDNWNNGDDWSIISGEFAGHHYSGNSEADRYLTLTNSLDLSAYTDDTVSIAWNQDESGNLESTDRLYFAVSGDGGNTWSSNIEAFRNDNPSSSYSYAVPAQYLTDDFKIRFYLYGFSGSSEYAYIDNISIEVIQLTADYTCYFKIDGTQVYFNGTTPTQGSGMLIADSTQLINNSDYGNPHGYSYSSFKDVTELVRAFSAKAADPAINHPGNGTYTVGDVNAEENSRDEWAYAGWSLVIIYSSAETEGHQLYLYDNFLYNDHQSNLDFDQDGQPGGTISGFLVPEPVAGETIAAKITCFVGEGDGWYNGDFLALNAPNNNPPTSISDAYKLDDGTGGGVNDVWNGDSIGLTAEGIDIDTFYVTWSSGLLSPGDTNAQVDIYTDIDIWNLVYIILSFRSEITTGGTISYLIIN